MTTRYYSRTLSSWPVGVTSLKKKKAYASTLAAKLSATLRKLTDTQEAPAHAHPTNALCCQTRRETTIARREHSLPRPLRRGISGATRLLHESSVDAGRHQLRRRQSGQKPPQPALLLPLPRSRTPPHSYPQSVLAHTHRRTD